MAEDSGTRKTTKVAAGSAGKDDSVLTPEEIDGLADLFASAPVEDDEDTLQLMSRLLRSLEDEGLIETSD